MNTETQKALIHHIFNAKTFTRFMYLTISPEENKFV